MVVYQKKSRKWYCNRLITHPSLHWLQKNPTRFYVILSVQLYK